MEYKTGDKVIVTTADLEPIIMKDSIYEVMVCYPRDKRIKERIKVKGEGYEGKILYFDEVSKVDTFQNLNLREGDVIRCVAIHLNGVFIKGKCYTVGEDTDEFDRILQTNFSSVSLFEVLSRAKDQEFPVWKDLSVEKKKDLLLLQHEKGPSAIEICLPSTDRWVEKNHQDWLGDMKYRAKKEPEVVDLYVHKGHAKKKIGTISLVNGIPSKDSIQLEI